MYSWFSVIKLSPEKYFVCFIWGREKEKAAGGLCQKVKQTKWVYSSEST